jgi:hypothetical protein
MIVQDGRYSIALAAMIVGITVSLIAVASLYDVDILFPKG